MTNPLHLAAMPAAATGALLTHEATAPVIAELPVSDKDKEFAQSAADTVGGLGGFVAGVWGLSKVGQYIPAVAKIEKAGAALGAKMPTVAACTSLAAAPALPWLAAKKTAEENASLQRKAAKDNLERNGVNVASYAQAFTDPADGTKFRGVSEYAQEDFDRLLSDVFWMSAAYEDKGTDGAMAEIDTLIRKHYSNEYSWGWGWQEHPRTDLTFLLLRWISIYQPELAAPIRAKYFDPFSLEVPGDQPSIDHPVSLAMR